MPNSHHIIKSYPSEAEWERFMVIFNKSYQHFQNTGDSSSHLSLSDLVVTLHMPSIKSHLWLVKKVTCFLRQNEFNQLYCTDCCLLFPNYFVSCTDSEVTSYEDQMQVLALNLMYVIVFWKMEQTHVAVDHFWSSAATVSNMCHLISSLNDNSCKCELIKYSRSCHNKEIALAIENTDPRTTSQTTICPNCKSADFTRNNTWNTKCVITLEITAS